MLDKNHITVFFLQFLSYVQEQCRKPKKVYKKSTLQIRRLYFTNLYSLLVNSYCTFPIIEFTCSSDCSSPACIPVRLRPACVASKPSLTAPSTAEAGEVRQPTHSGDTKPQQIFNHQQIILRLPKPAYSNSPTYEYMLLFGTVYTLVFRCFVTSTFSYSFYIQFHWPQYVLYCTIHRRRIKTEENANVVASVWGTGFIQFLNAIAVSHQDELKNRIKCTRMI